MTCVVGIIDSGRAYFGADSIVASEASCDRLAHPKVWRNKAGWVAGWAGHATPGLALEYLLELPSPPLKDCDLDRWAMTDVLDAVNIAVRDRWPECEGDDKEATDLDVLIGVRGRLYLVESRTMVTRIPRKYHAIGTGGDVALGSLRETVRLPTRERIVRALSAAEAHVTNVRRPWRFAGP